jgi:hypothetical protein
MRQLLVTCATALALLITGCSTGESAPPANAAHGTEFKATTPHIAVKHGDRFSVVVDEKDGDRWVLRVSPDPKIARAESQESAGGKRYFVFTADQVGESAIEVYDGARSAGYSVHLSVI